MRQLQRQRQHGIAAAAAIVTVTPPTTTAAPIPDDAPTVAVAVARMPAVSRLSSVLFGFTSFVIWLCSKGVRDQHQCLVLQLLY
jgi:hypothetical protein